MIQTLIKPFLNNGYLMTLYDLRPPGTFFDRYPRSFAMTLIKTKLPITIYQGSHTSVLKLKRLCLYKNNQVEVKNAPFGGLAGSIQVMHGKI